MTTARTKTKAAAAKAETKATEMFDMANQDMPAAFRDMAENGMVQAKEAYDKMRDAAEQASDMIEDNFEAARKSMVAFNIKAIDTAKENTNALFSFWKDIVSAKTVSEAIELQSSFAAKQYEAYAAQTKDMQDMLADYAKDAGQPVKDMFEKAMKDLRTV